MRKYTQLTYNQRYHIYTFMKSGYCQTEIGETIGVHKSTISREIKRNGGNQGYHPKQVHQFAIMRQDKAKARVRIEDWIWIEELIYLNWGTEQISDYLRKERILQISHEWICQHICGKI